MQLNLLINIGFSPESLQSDEYLKRAAPILKERMMYASARLYNIIVDIYGEDEDDDNCVSCLIADMIEAFLQWDSAKKDWLPWFNLINTTYEFNS